MPYCWKCGEPLPDAAAPCPACGATADARRPLPDNASDEARALRAIYDCYGCKQVLTQSTLLYNALGDFLGEDGRTLRNQVRTAMDAGLGRLYLAELTAPTPGFHARATQLLAREGLTADTVQYLIALFGDMTGLPAPAAPAPAPVTPPPAASDKPAPTAPVAPRPLPPVTPASQPRKSIVLLIALVAVLAIALAVLAGTLIGRNSVTSDSKTESTATVTAIADPTEEPTPVPTDVPTEKPTPVPTDVPTEVPTPVLTDVPANWGELQKDDSTYMVFGSQYHRSSIHSITFRDTTSGKPADAWDVSSDKDGSVWAWVTRANVIGHWGAPLYDLTIASEGGVRLPKDSSALFKNYMNVVSIEFGNCVDTSSVTDMGRMFYACQALTTLDLSSFNTSSVTSMRSMFARCESLTALDISSFDTSSVTDMDWMFFRCNALTTLNLSSFNTSSVTDMSWMFSRCQALTSVTASHSFVIPNGANTSDMFTNCPLQSISDFTIVP